MSIKWEGTALQLTLTWRGVLESAYWLVAILLGGAQAWVFRHQPSSVDAVSYLDIGDAYIGGNWQAALNGLWNPLYSWILGLVLVVAQPSAWLEYPLVKAVDFAIFLATLVSFRWFLGNLRAAYHASTQEPAGRAAIPDWIWIAGGYTLFIWSSLTWIKVSSNTPDMAGSALAYCAWGLLFRLQVREERSGYSLLGAVLAVGYFARTPMLIIGGAILLLMAVPGRSPSRRRGAVVACVVFVVMTLPFIASLSLAHGHLTIGDNSKLNHAWLANPGRYIIPDTNWQGGPPGYGAPRHPTRLLWNAPPTFEFATPIGGTYPPWTDPSYWYEGLTYHFDAAAEWTTLKDNLQVYFQLFGKWLLLAIAAVVVAAGDFRATLGAARRNIGYWGPAALGLVLFLVADDLLVQWLPAQPLTRYIGGYISLFCLTLFSCVRLRSVEPSRLKTWGVAAFVAAISVLILATLTMDMRRELGDPFSPRLYAAGPPWRLAEGLQQIGVGSRMPIAIVGDKSRHEYWARLARVRIIAQVTDDRDFWRKSPAVRDVILRLLARTGARVVVSSRIPEAATGEGWRLVPNSEHGLRVLADGW